MRVAAAFVWVMVVGLGVFSGERLGAIAWAESAPSATDPAGKAPAPAAETPKATPAGVAKGAKVEAAKKSDATDYKGYGKTRGVLGDVTFGPSIAILGFPHPAEVSLEGKYLDLFGFQAAYGFLPEITISNVKAKMNAWDVRARWFPFRGAMFIGAAYGQQTLTGSKSDTISGVPVQATVEVKTNYITPHLGWRWVWESGFFMGVDFGWQLASSAKTTVSTNAPAAVQATTEYISLRGKVTDAGNDLGETGLPSVTFIRLGWLF